MKCNSDQPRFQLGISSAESLLRHDCQPSPGQPGSFFAAICVCHPLPETDPHVARAESRGLESESVRFKGGFGLDSIATPEEREFLRGNQRVELNAFTSADFIKWIESKLDEHGIQKVIPDDETLELAFRRAFQGLVIGKAHKGHEVQH